MEMTITDFARMGGRARWKKTTKKERSKAMSELARLPRKSTKRAKRGAKARLLDNEIVIQQAISKKT
jgi:hypothetical protein